MIITDKLLLDNFKKNGPIRVGLIGTGKMGTAIAHQLVNYSKGINLAAVANRTIEKAVGTYKSAGIKKIGTAKTQAELDESINDNVKAVSQNPFLISKSKYIDVIIEATGSLEFGAGITLSAINSGKHVILMNAELDATLGPILKTYADKKGVIFTNADGDQPGVILNLYRFVKGIGLIPLLCGNIKGLHDPYRTPATQASYAKKWDQNVNKVTSFAGFGFDL